MSNETKPATFKVAIAKAGHSDNGKPCAIGDVIEVTEAQRAFLHAQGVIADAATPAKAAKE